MINTNFHPNKKGIYKDMYRAIDAENNKRQKVLIVPRQKKGIYKDLYRQMEEDKKNIEFKGNSNSIDEKSFWYKIFSKILSYSSFLTSYIKPVIENL